MVTFSLVNSVSSHLALLAMRVMTNGSAAQSRSRAPGIEVGALQGLGEVPGVGQVALMASHTWSMVQAAV